MTHKDHLQRLIQIIENDDLMFSNFPPLVEAKQSLSETPIHSGEERLWLNMKDAPKDGTYILLYDDSGVHKAAWLDDSDGYGKTRNYCWAIEYTGGDEQGGYARVDDPKGWQPLPKPPNGEQKSNAGEERLFTLKDGKEFFEAGVKSTGLPDKCVNGFDDNKFCDEKFKCKMCADFETFNSLLSSEQKVNNEK